MANKPDLSFNWSTPLPIPEGEPDIPRDDSTPPIKEQAVVNGWELDYFDFGKAEIEGVENFNPSIVERSDGRWLLVRRSEPHPQGFKFGQNDIWAFKLEGVMPTFGKRLKWNNKEPSQHFEDPRGFYHPKYQQTVVGACTFVWYPNQPWTGAHQCVGIFDDGWNPKGNPVYPRIGGNPGEMKRIEKPENYEKNWLFWLHEDRLHLLYKAKPWLVYGFGQTWNDITQWKDETGASWTWGDIRGGTPPVLVGDYYFTFHHSSLPWRGRYRRYYAGCLAFESKPPFRPRLITKEPILMGSQNDTWVQRKPLVVFPCGALYNRGEWLVTLGVNDMKAAYLRLTHDSLLKKMTPLIDNAPIFERSGLSENEERLLNGKQIPEGASVSSAQTQKDSEEPESPVQTLKEKRQANAAKARAALAEKRKALSGGGDSIAHGGALGVAAVSIRAGSSEKEHCGETPQSALVQVQPRTRKRRRRKFKRVTAEARRKALAEFTAKKNLAESNVGA